MRWRKWLASTGGSTPASPTPGYSTPPAALLDTSLADFRAVTRVDLDGAFTTLREAARQMVAAGNGGSLVATSSMSVLMGMARNYAYTASKSALVAIVKALAVELARHGIRANALLPGWTESGVTASRFADETFTRKVLPRVPVRRWGPVRISPGSRSTWPARLRRSTPGTPSSSTAATPPSDPPRAGGSLRPGHGRCVTIR